MDFIVIGTNVIAVEQEPEEFPYSCICHVCDKPFFALVPEADLCEDCELAMRHPWLQN